MLDLALATKLVEALPDDGRLILLGDKDQLSAVETGTVFANLCATRGMGAETRESVEALSDETLPETVASGRRKGSPMPWCGSSRDIATHRAARSGRWSCQGGRCRSGAGLALEALRVKSAPRSCGRTRCPGRSIWPRP
jgi:AAA domain-containing protein